MSASDTSTILARLNATPRPLEHLEGAPRAGGLPARPGFYAWWARAEALAELPWRPNAADPSWGLLYVGIAPVRPTSTQTLRSRVIANHLRGNIGSSTFRFSLAALLRDELSLDPQQRKTKVVLSPEDNTALSNWQRTQLRMTWCEREHPWEMESSVISALDPPLNLAGQAGREFHSELTGARAALRHAV